MEKNNLSIRKLGRLSAWDRERWLLVISFLVVYTVWGSTYLGIKFAIQTLPPYLMAGSRFFVAGAIMLVWGILKGASLPRGRQWRDAAVTGFLLLVMGNGGIVFASQYLPSGVIALFVTIEPFWVIFLMMIGKTRLSLNWKMILGLFLGFSGTLVLLAPGFIKSEQALNPLGILVLLLSTFCWALGSVTGARAASPASFQITLGVQMLSGGLILLILSGLSGEFQHMDMANASIISISAFLYLLVFGSLIGYSAYSYLVKYASPSQVSTYAYVNPLVAVLLGAWLGKEIISIEIVVSAFLLVSGVVLILSQKGK